MANNVLQDYFNRMTALNRQRGMTGNMQYGKALDSSIAEGYFDSYEKNKAASDTRANQKAQLAVMQQGADTAAAAQKSNAAYQAGILAHHSTQNDAYSKALTQSNALGWGSLATTALGAGTKLYLGREPQPKIETPSSWNTDVNVGEQNYVDLTNLFQQPALVSSSNTMANGYALNDSAPTMDFSGQYNVSADQTFNNAVADDSSYLDWFGDWAGSIFD